MIRPLNKYLLIELEQEQEKTSGGLYMPQGSNANAIDILKKGKILDMSLEVKEKLDLLPCKNKAEESNDCYVYYNKHAITKIPGEPSLAFVRLEDVYALV